MRELDFGKEWFDMLKDEKDNGTRWSEIADKDESIYVPLLQSFMDEVNRAYKEDQNMP